MDAFFLVVIGVVLLAYVVYIIVSIRIERRVRANNGSRQVEH
jgi:hypothetical protein